MRIQFYEEKRQRLQLFGAENIQGWRAAKNGQRRKIQNETDAGNGASREAEEHGEQRKVPVYWLKQKIEEQRRREIINGRDEAGHDGPAKQGLVCQNVVRGRCGVA